MPRTGTGSPSRSCLARSPSRTRRFPATGGGAADRLGPEQGQQLAHRCDVCRPGPGDQRAACDQAAGRRRGNRLGQYGRGSGASTRRYGPWRAACARCTRTCMTMRRSARRSAASMSRRSAAARSSATWSSRPSTRSCAFTRRPASRRYCSATFVRSFAGLSVDSAELFGLLQRHITRLDNTVRWSRHRLCGVGGLIHVQRHRRIPLDSSRAPSKPRLPSTAGGPGPKITPVGT
jgi:hypothetical protein